MKKLWVLSFCIVFFLACDKKDIDVSPVSDIDSLPTIETLNNKDGYLMRVNDDLTVIVVEGVMDPLSCAAQPSHRFTVANLPAELKGKHETKIVFSGEVKQRLQQENFILYAGIPLKLTKIKLK
jgi:hypothetical protein